MRRGDRRGYALGHVYFWSYTNVRAGVVLANSVGKMALGKLENKIALVTGASSGLGYQFVLTLAAQWAAVPCRSAQSLRKWRGAEGG